MTKFLIGFIGLGLLGLVACQAGNNTSSSKSKDIVAIQTDDASVKVNESAVDINAAGASVKAGKSGVNIQAEGSSVVIGEDGSVNIAGEGATIKLPGF